MYPAYPNTAYATPACAIIVVWLFVLCSPVSLAAAVQDQPRAKLSAQGQHAWRTMRSIESAWVEQSIAMLRQEPAGDQWLGYVMTIDQPLVGSRGLKGNSDERRAARQQLTERLYAAIAQSVRWQPAPAPLDGIIYRLEKNPEQLSAATEVDLLLTVLVHRPEYLTAWQQQTRSPQPSLVIALLNLEPRLGRNMAGLLLERVLREPSTESEAVLESIAVTHYHQQALLTVAEAWQQREASPDQWLLLLMRLKHVPPSLSAQRDRWILDTNNTRLAIAAALSRLVGDRSPENGNTLSNANLTQALEATSSAVHRMTLSFIAAQRSQEQALDGSDELGERLVNHHKRLQALRKAHAATPE